MFDFTDEKNIGKEYKGFVLLSIDELSDYKCRGVYLRHKRTGLEVYHMLKDDKENLFAFAFRTLAKNSKGAAHIMEHSVLCGSEKYNLKEPFNTLASTSLNTYLNALTYPDKTVYPGASVVRDDYFNMMDVYADAVFFPRLDHSTFIQEGHRLELDEKGKLSVQGVVYNEMKGNYSSFQQVAFSNLINKMFPDCYPAFDSGGDPLEIPNLTYQEFLDFHQTFYNPDNCILFLYGDIPTSDQLDFLDERFMGRIAKKYNCVSDVPNAESKEPLLTPQIKELLQFNKQNKSAEYTAFAPETGATGNFVTMNWYSGEPDMEQYYLSEVIAGNDSSPLNMALKESGLGDEVSCGNFSQFMETFFTAGLLGVKKGNEQKVYKIIEETIKNMYENGVSQEDIDSAVMGIDFNLREENRYWGPFSMQIMEKALKAWTHGKPCPNQLTPISSFEKVKEKIRADKDYTKKLIKKYFIDQEICIKYVSEPSSKYFKERNKSEADLISRLEKNLDKNQLKKDLDELHAYQQKIETPEETACIPTTKLSSLDKKIDIPHTDLQFVEGADGSNIPLFVSKEETNGIFYIDVLYPFDNLDAKYIQHIPFMTSVITNLGWNGKKWDECIAESACVMGDVWGRTCCGKVCNVPGCITEAQKYKDYNFCNRNWIGLSCKALTDQAEESLKLLAQIITKMSFDDEKRFENLTQELIAEKKGGIVANGRDYVMKRARALNSEMTAINEIMWGVSQLETVKNYKKTKAKETLETFKYMYYECLKSGGIIHITADEDSLKKLEPLIKKFSKEAGFTKLLPGKRYSVEELKPYILQADAAADSETAQILSVESQTGYAAAVTSCSDYLTDETAAEIIFATWFSNHTLWDRIRTTGGAYGGGAFLDSMENSLIFHTYRDPTPEKSIQVFKDSLKEISSIKIPEEDIEKTIVSCYGDAIVPVSPKDRGARSFEGMLYGNPQDLRLKRVDQVLSVKPADVEKAAKRLYENVCKRYTKAVFCDIKNKISGNKINIPL